MITFVQSVIVPVTDQDAALEFYTQHLGFERRDDNRIDDATRWLEVAPRGAATVVVLASGSLVPQGRAPGGPTGVVLETDDIQATYTQLARRGVQFDGPPQGAPEWGYQATLRDRDGNTYALHQRGAGK